MNARDPRDELEALFDAHAEWLLQRALRLGLDREEARDVVSDTFVVAHQSLASRTGESPRAWLAGILYRKVLHARRRYARKEGRWTASYDDELPPTSAPAEQEAQTMQRRQQEIIAGCINKHVQDEDDHRILDLSVWGDLPSGEIGALLGMKASTIRRRLQSIRLKLKACLKGHWEEIR